MIQRNYNARLAFANIILMAICVYNQGTLLLYIVRTMYIQLNGNNLISIFVLAMKLCSKLLHISLFYSTYVARTLYYIHSYLFIFVLLLSQK